MSINNYLILKWIFYVGKSPHHIISSIWPFVNEWHLHTWHRLRRHELSFLNFYFKQLNTIKSKGSYVSMLTKHSCDHGSDGTPISKEQSSQSTFSKSTFPSISYLVVVLLFAFRRPHVFLFYLSSLATSHDIAPKWKGN